MTPNDIIVLALKASGVLGVGQAASTDDLNDGLTMLNMMVSQWSQKRWLDFRDLDIAATCTGAGNFTVGPGGTFDTPRPDKIEAAFARLLSGTYPVDYPLEVIDAREDWNNIAIKSQPGFPMMVFYDAQSPMGVINIYPVPSPAFELHLTLKQALTSFATLTETIGLPPQYNEALFYNLALRLAPAYQIAVSREVTMLAASSLNTIRNSNAQIGHLQMPSGLPGMEIYGFGTGVAGGFTGFPAGSYIDGIGTLAPGAEGAGLLDQMAVTHYGVVNHSVLGTFSLSP